MTRAATPLCGCLMQLTSWHEPGRWSLARGRPPTRSGQRSATSRWRTVSAPDEGSGGPVRVVAGGGERGGGVVVRGVAGSGATMRVRPQLGLAAAGGGRRWCCGGVVGVARRSGGVVGPEVRPSTRPGAPQPVGGGERARARPGGVSAGAAVVGRGRSLGDRAGGAGRGGAPGRAGWPSVATGRSGRAQ